VQRKQLPRTNLQVSVIDLGTDYFGSTVDAKLSMQILDRYVESGGNFIDTAEVYANWNRDHPAVPEEEILVALETFRRAGKIRNSGFSNWRQSRAEAPREAALRLGIPGFVASQNMWSLGQVKLANADPTWAYIDRRCCVFARSYHLAPPASLLSSLERLALQRQLFHFFLQCAHSTEKLRQLSYRDHLSLGFLLRDGGKPT
jgi:hypothetical protein